MIPIIINGLVIGAAYGILAVGFSLIFGVAKILNLSHTAFYMLTSFLIYIATSILNIPLLPSVFMAIIVTTILGVVSYKLFFDRVKEHETAVMIISVALAMFLQEALLIIFGGEYVEVPSFVSGFVEIAGTRVTCQHIIVIGFSGVTIYGLWLLLNKTKLGKTIRAVAQDSEIANLMGINVTRVQMIVMGLSVVMGGIAAALVAPIYPVHALMWIDPLTIVLATVVLGGLGSTFGCIIAAVILGITETAVTFLFPMGSFLKGACSLSIMVAVLLIRPEGLFGVKFEEERL